MISEKLKSIKPSATLAINAKANELIKNGENVIKFGAGEPDFDAPDNIKMAAKKAVDDNFSKYTSASGIPELKAAISEKFKIENNINYNSEEVMSGTGAKQILYNTLQSLCNPNDEVVLVSPFWLSYAELIRLVDAKPVIVKTEETENFELGADSLKEKITDKTKVIVINSPCNPTGAVINKNELKKIADLILEKNIYVISDECYEHIIYDDEHISIASLNSEIKEKTITVNALSKTYAVPGWRLGYCGANKDLIKSMTAVQSHTAGNPCSIVQKAAIEALAGNQESVKKMCEEFQKRRDYIYKRMSEMQNISCVKPKGAFYVFPNVSKTKNYKGSVDFCNRLLDEAKIAIVPGEVFGSDSHVRFSFASSMKDIEEGMDRFENWLR